MRLTPLATLALLTFANVVNYVDRGIVAGAGTDIKGCVEDALVCGHVRKVRKCDNDPDSVPCSSCRVCGTACDGRVVSQTGLGISDFRLGVVQSLFMVGYMLGSFVFSHVVHGRRIYLLLGIGMSLWTLAAISSGLSGFIADHSVAATVLGASRALSGIGEAALATLALPHLDDIVPHESRGKYIAVYLSAMPFGTAVGYAWAGIMSENLGWEWAFLLEAPLMLPVCLFFLVAPLDAKLREGLPAAVPAEETEDSSSASAADRPLLQRENSTGDSEDEPLPSVVQDVISCLKSPVFTLASLGLAAYTFATAGLAFYTPMFLQEYRPCDPEWSFTEESADEAFGVSVASAGLVGVVAGGWLVDDSARFFSGNDSVRALKLSLAELLLAAVTLGLAGAVTNVNGFFALVWLACTLCFLTTAPNNCVLLNSVPVRLRSMSMALSLVIAHLFGDVPSPSIIGLVADGYAPMAAYFTAWMGLPFGLLFWSLATVQAARAIE